MGWRAGASAVAVWLSLLVASPALAAKNLLNNGDLDRGSGDSVDGWRIDAWVLSPGTTDYHWIAPHGSEPGEVEVFTHRDNDARWVQGLNLGPGWYYIGASVRTRGVLPYFDGASVSVLEDGIMSEDLRGDNDWKRIGLYLKVGSGGADIDVALRLGGYMNLTRGQAFFRGARVVKVLAPPLGAMHVFDLEKIRKSEVSGPIGHRWTLVTTFILLGVTTLIGWRLMAEPPFRRI
ncbi:MAG TPA: hypothetical protein VJN94_18165 [Candidatus Binataceae bacterium]|nr:hypothetical protein [Candidatus Binataceae bacterium]